MDELPSAVTVRASRCRNVVLIGLCAAAAIAYLQRLPLGVIEAEMRKELGLTTRESAWVMSTSFFLAYALFQVPAGWIGQLWGSRRTLAVFAAMCAALHGSCFFLYSAGALLAVRAIMGICQAALFPCTTATIKDWFPSSKWGVSNGLLTAFQQLGGAAGMLLAGILAADFGWRFPFLAFTLPGLVWAVWFWIWFRDRPEDHRGVNAAELEYIRGGSTVAQTTTSNAAKIGVPWKKILANWTVFWICVQQYFRGAGYIFYSSWFASYLKATRNVDLKEAGWLTSFPLWANALGCVAGGGLSDWLLQRTGSRRISRQILAFVSQLACASLALAAYFIEDVRLATLTISLGSFCAAAGGPIAYAVTIDLGGRHVRPLFGLMNMCGNLGSFSFPLIIAMVIGDDPKPADWGPVLPIFAGVYVLAGIAWLGFNADRPLAFAASGVGNLENNSANDKLPPTQSKVD